MKPTKRAESRTPNSFTARKCRLIITLMRKPPGISSAISTNLPARLSNTQIRRASASARQTKKPTDARSPPIRFRLSAESSRLIERLTRKSPRELIEVFTEVVIAPDFAEDALEIFKTKKNLRVLRVEKNENQTPLEYKQISGGFLVQDRDSLQISAKDLNIVSKKQPTEEEIRALLFAWKVCKHVKSNAIVFANENQTARRRRGTNEPR